MTEREQVGRGRVVEVRAGVGEQLGGPVAVGADQHVLGGDVGRPLGPREAEVDQYRLVGAVGARRALVDFPRRKRIGLERAGGDDEHVAALDVPVHDAHLVHLVDGERQQPEDFDQLAEGALVLVRPLHQREAVDEVHHQVERTGHRVRPAVVAVHSDDAGVLERHQRADLPEDPGLGNSPVVG